MKAWKHFCTITHHRLVVMRGCFRIGLYWQGLTHDLSKYSPTEFRVGARYYQGTRSPNAVERAEIGYSTAWIHHKGRNRHHFEYWMDSPSGSSVYVPLEMPRRYLCEMVMDRIAACKIYHGKAYRDGDALAYLERAYESTAMHPVTRAQLTVILTHLRDHGEASMCRFLREKVLTGERFW